ncbi:MAG: DMT family transporter [Ignavibacteria bacterium]|nr:DMT family transporter [Ignavibacteria bacterium]
MTRQQHAYLAAGAAILCWSTVATAFKFSLRSIDVLDLLAVSSLSSCLTLAAVLAMQRKLAGVLSWPMREYARSAMLGALNPLLYYLVLFKAYSLLPAQEAQPLNYTWPLVLVLLSALVLRQRVSARILVALLVSFAGVLLISTHGEVFSLRFSDPFGVALAIGSSAIWATYWIMTMKDERGPVERLLVNSIFGTAFVAVLYVVSGRLRMLPVEGIIGGVYVGIFEMGLAFVLWLRALHFSKTTAMVGNLVFLSPFLSLIVIHFVLGEAVRTSTIAGLVLIVGGILIQQTARRPVAHETDTHG